MTLNTYAQPPRRHRHERTAREALAVSYEALMRDRDLMKVVPLEAGRSVAVG